MSVGAIVTVYGQEWEIWLIEDGVLHLISQDGQGIAILETEI